MAVGAANAASWERTLERVVPSVVMIRSYAPRSFEGRTAGSSYATGFVVDAERGIILSNRHVVRTGPVVAGAVLQNNEELELTPIYRDPVHDFGFFSFDPDDVRFQSLKALPLRPDQAKQGADIRLIGSDAGEKVSILGGTLADLDREAPTYGQGRYNDFNTFYIQAALSSSGGSSGSPVVDINGHVVALNAGSNRKAASSFFLPLDRVQRALKKIQKEQPVSRGTVHTTFLHQTFDEAKRLGLSDEAERTMRKGGTGVLVVERVLLGGSSDGRLEPGDILTHIDGASMHDFVSMEAMLDDRVGDRLMFQIERGGEALKIDVPVADLHAVSPSDFIEIADGVMHDFSYQSARHYQMETKGVYVSSSAFNGAVASGQVIHAVNGVLVPNLDAFEAEINKVADGEDFVVQSSYPGRQNQVGVIGITMNRTWFPSQRCTRSPTERFWPCRALISPPPKDLRVKSALAAWPASGKVAQRYADSLVGVEFRVPYRTNGVYGNRFTGVGIVVDASKGLVLVDRDTVPVGLGEVTIIFGGSTEISGSVHALHPLHNLALVQYDPALVEGMAIGEVRFDGPELERDDKAKLVGLTVHKRIQAESVVVANVGELKTRVPVVPGFMERNLDMIQLTDLSAPFIGGLITDKRGRASAMWVSVPDLSDDERDNWWRGIPAKVVNEFLADPSGAHSWGIEFSTSSVVAAQRRGLDPNWITQVAESSSDAPKILEVKRVTKGGAADGLVQSGDLLLSVDGGLVSTLAEAKPGTGVSRLALLRNGAPIEVDLESRRLTSDPTDRVVLWGGALFQAPHLAIAQQRGQERTGVYVSSWWRGSPAGRFGLRPMRRVVAVDGQPTPDLDAFVEAVRNKQSGDATRLLTIDVRGVRKMVTTEADNHYWPLVELQRSGDDWSRVPVEVTDAGGG